MKQLIKISALLLFTSILLINCEFIKHGKEAFLGTFNTEIDYDITKSYVEFAVDPNDDLDNDVTTNPPTTYNAFGSDFVSDFIDLYFNESTATIKDMGGDSVKYTDSKRTLYGCIKGDSILFRSTDLGEAPSMNEVVIDSTIMTVKAVSISNDIHMYYEFSGIGSVEFPPTVFNNGIVRGTVKMVARK